MQQQQTVTTLHGLSTPSSIGTTPESASMPASEALRIQRCFGLIISSATSPETEASTSNSAIARPLQLERPCSPANHQGPDAEIAAPESPAGMATEIDLLPESQTLYQSGDYQVCYFRRAQAPQLMNEIGRLREVSFREVGEGTGRERDLDRYDDWYLQLLVWHRGERQVMGAYRLCMTDVVRREVGSSGLYTKSLFTYDESFLTRLGPALELGRSFVRPELQGAGRVLAMLWRGIGRLVAANPRYRTLFGPVSVSSTYTEESRRLIATRLQQGQFRHDNFGSVAPLRPVSPLTGQLAEIDEGIRELSKRVMNLEPDAKGLPILVKEYVKLGGKFLAFSVDPDFGDAMDGLVAVDLDATAPKLLQLYMGPDNYKRFRLGLAPHEAHGVLASAS